MTEIKNLSGLYHGEPVRVLDAVPGILPGRGEAYLHDDGFHAKKINPTNNPECFRWIDGHVLKEGNKWRFFNANRNFILNENMIVETRVDGPRLRMKENEPVPQDLFTGQQGQPLAPKKKRARSDADRAA